MLSAAVPKAVTLSSRLAKIEGFVPHDPIVIIGNADFTFENGVLQGLGTSEDPFVIEGWDVDASTAHGIRVENTRAYFVIRDACIHDGGDSHYGVYFENVTNGIIANSTINQNLIGIYLRKSGHSTLVDNELHFNSEGGIVIDGVYSAPPSPLWSQNIVKGNNISDAGCGVKINYGVLDNVIESNVISNTGDAIYIYFGGNNTIRNNSMSSVGSGIYIWGPFNILRSNTITNHQFFGLTVYGDYFQDIDTSNTINDKPIYYLMNQKDLVIEPSTFPNVGYLGLVNSQNITIQGLDLEKNADGVLFVNTTDSAIQNTIVRQNGRGITLLSCQRINVSRNTVSENGFGGIYLSNSNSSTISSNLVTFNVYFGIALIHYSSDNLVYENYVSHNNPNAYDEALKHLGMLNHWNTTRKEGNNIVGGSYIGGNYWSDYQGVDQNQDGIGDTPYTFETPGYYPNTDYLPIVPHTYSWSMFKHDLDRSGYSTTTAPNTNMTLWRVQPGPGGSFSSPAVVEEKVFVGIDPDTISALHLQNGSEIWSFNIGGYQVKSSPAVRDGMVFIGSTNDYGDNFFAINETTGELIWSFDAKGQIDSSPVIHNGRVFFGSSRYMGGSVWALDEYTGMELWNFSAGNFVRSSPAVSDGIVYVCSSDHNLYALNETDGTLIWKFDKAADSDPLVSKGSVVIGGSDGVYSLDKNTGNIVWSFPCGFARVSAGYSMIFVGECLYSDYSRRGALYALNETTGAEVWKYEPMPLDGITCSPAIADGKVFFASANGRIYSLDATIGKLIWSYYTGEETRNFGSPAVAYGRVFITSLCQNSYGGEYGFVYCFGDRVPASASLSVPYEAQGNAPLCWAASTAMILRYYGEQIHVWDVSKDLPVDLLLHPMSFGRIGTYIQEKFQGRYSTTIGHYGAVTEQTRKDIETNLTLGFPIMLCVDPPGPQTHSVVVTGYNATGFFINDPSGALFTQGLGRDESFPYIQEFATWEELQPLISQEDPIFSDAVFLVVKGIPSPIDATLYFQNRGWITVIHDGDARKGLCVDYGGHDLYAGQYWRSMGYHPIALDSKDVLGASYAILNAKNETMCFDFQLRIIEIENSGEASSHYEETILGLLAPPYDMVIASPKPISLGYVDGLISGQQYAIETTIRYHESTEIVDSIRSPYVWYGVSSMMFVTECPVRMLVIDPDGLRVGFDPILNQTLNEIPDALYYYGNETEPEIISIVNQKDGNYSISVYGMESGAYNLTCATLDETGFISTESYMNIQIEEGESQPYIIPEFSSFLVLPLFVAATLLTVLVCRRGKSSYPRDRKGVCGRRLHSKAFCSELLMLSGY
jgi:parallel beta-helix repeat protein